MKLHERAEIKAVMGKYFPKTIIVTDYFPKSEEEYNEYILKVVKSINIKEL